MRAAATGAERRRQGALALVLLAAASAPAAARTYPSAAETRGEFEAVCRRLADRNVYFGDHQVEALRARLAGSDAAGADIADRSEARLLRGQLGWELARLGRLEEAAAELERAAASFGEEPAADNATQDLERRVLSTLGSTYLLLAEDQNCVERHSARSCILPIAPEATHTLPAHSRRAGDLFAEILDRWPDDVQARWLLNLSRMISGDYPDGVPARLRLPAGALESRVSHREWRDIAPHLGVNAFDLSGGAVMDDFDGDGLLDLVSSTSDPCGPLKAFRNDGRGGFSDATADWGLDGQLGGLNLVQADFDDDGRLDLLVLRGGWLGRDGRIRNSLLRNDLGGESRVFQDVTAAAGLAYPAFPTQTAAWADFDLDGDLDLFVGNEAGAVSADPLALFGAEGEAYPSQLFRNNGDRTFTNVSRAAGLGQSRFIKSVAWGDIDNDGDPDLHLSASGENALMRNNGDGTFTAVGREVGALGETSLTFASWFFDFDNDGDLDLFVADYSTPYQRVSASYLGQTVAGGRPRLFVNQDGRFQESSTRLGFDRPLLPMGANFGDLDNDGWLDLYLGTGLPDFAALMPNVMYRNLEGGGFVDVTFAGGFGHLQKGHGVAFGDLDNDGDQDLFHQLGGAFPFDAYGNALFENPTTGQAWVTLRLRGATANRFGLGARIEVRLATAGGDRSIHRVVGSGGSFGGSSLQTEIGLGPAAGLDEIESITIAWPGSPGVQTFTAVAPNRIYLARQGEERLSVVDLPPIRLTGSGAGSDGG